jgi:hypothetical protein
MIDTLLFQFLLAATIHAVVSGLTVRFPFPQPQPIHPDFIDLMEIIIVD